MSNFTKNEVIRLLEDSNLIIPVKGGKYIINVILAKHLKTRKSERCDDFPEKFIGLSDAHVYKKIMVLCDLPLTHSNANGKSYIIKTTTKESVRVLKTILNSREINFKQFIKKTKEFYKSNTMVPGFANYLITNVWEEVYDSEEQAGSTVRDRKGII